MRPPFAPRGPPFDPREADSFFRPPFEEMRGRPGPHIRPPFGPMGPPAMHGPDGPWRNQEGSGPPAASWPGQEPDAHGQRENHLPRDKQKLQAKHQDYKSLSERESRNRNRKSRWGNVSPPLTDDTDEVPSDVGENKMRTSDGGEAEAKDCLADAPSAADQPRSLPTRESEQDDPATHVRDTHRENETTSIPNDEDRRAYEVSAADHFSSRSLAVKQQGEEEQCEYETPIPAEDSAQQSAMQSVEQIGHVSESHSERSVEQQADSL